jgi:hypothetical protein
VVLDEMNTGHSVYRLNVDDLDGGDEDAVTGIDAARVPHQTKPLPRRLPEPVLRLGYQSVGTFAQFKALGSKIVATGVSSGNGTITFVYDTKTARLDVGQSPPKGLNLLCYHAAEAGNKLYAFGANSQTFYLCEQWVLPEDDGYDSGNEMSEFAMRGQIKEWAWKKSRSSLRCAANLSSHTSFVQSYAMHPDGKTLFVSCFSSNYIEPHRHFTFSVVTKDVKSTRPGEWRLPFNDRGYYDHDLDAWVGIRMADGTDGGSEGHSYLCSCDAPKLEGGRALPAPAWKMCKEQLTFLDTPAAHCCALVHTGRGRFCLVEVLAAPVAKGEEARRRTRDGLEFLLHVTMFRAKHGKNGELLVAPCRPGRSFLMPNYATGTPTAFWMLRFLLASFILL